MSDFSYTCDGAQKALIELVKIAGDAGLLQVSPDKGILHQCVEKCSVCSRGKQAKHCLGWHTVVDRGILWFGPIDYRGKGTIRLALSANCSFRRPAPGRQPEWDKAPLTSSVVTVEIFDVNTETLIERHHLDLANAGQPGPVWHLQYGGNPAGDIDGLPTSWLQPPRWPMAPMDLTLAIEFLAYSFFPDKWERLNGSGEWLRLIGGAEQLVVSHFSRRMAEHFDCAPGRRVETWLAAQDNEYGTLDARPSTDQ